MILKLNSIRGFALRVKILISNLTTAKNITRVFILLLSSLLLVSLVIYVISLNSEDDAETYTTVIDVRKDGRLTLDAYLSSHPWRNMSSQEDFIRRQLDLDLDSRQSQWRQLSECRGVPMNLQGRVQVQPYLHDVTTLEVMHPDMHGGRWEPKTCESSQKVAIIVPHRGREHHLLVLLHNLIPFLQRQQVDFTVFVVNQAPPSQFNRAILFNIGFLEASRLFPYDCFIFHDVDLLPLDDRNLYSCGHYPRHMTVAIDKFHFREIGPEAFGGVVSFTREQFERINGASNLFFGWGGEDDDLWRRVHASNMIVVRYPTSVSRYSMMKHDRDRGNWDNPYRHALLDTSVYRMAEDGLSTVKYKRIGTQATKLFVWVDVEVDEYLIWKNASADWGSIQNRPPGDTD